MEYLVKALFGEEAQFHAGFFQGNVLFVCQFDCLRRVLISDIGIERRHEHQGVVEVVVHFAGICLDAHCAVDIKGGNGFREQSDGLQEIVGDHGHEDVQFEVALGSRKADRRVVSHHLDRDSPCRA